jgi:hypothetical protein
MSIQLLDLDLALRRDATLLWLACAFAAAAAALFALGTQPLKAHVEARAEDLARAERQALSARSALPVAPSLFDERLGAFNDTLGDRSRLNAFVQTVFDQAAKRNLVLAQAEYKLDFDKAGRFHTYQMILPVRGSYPRLRAFVDAVLVEVQCAALEDVDFKREGIAESEAEARLRFVFFLKDAES